MIDERSRAWLERGSHSTWRVGGRELRYFHLEAGPRDAPLLVLVHGFPTSSIDWCDVVEPLAERFRVAVVDFPGYGFSDKPRDWPYSITLDAQLLHDHVVEVLGAHECRVVAHDRGDSVALLLHHDIARGEIDDLRIEHLVLTNGNIFLPLANLTEFQKRTLDASQWETIRDVVTPDALAAGIGATTFTPPRPPDDPAIVALATTFAFGDGTAVLHGTIQYLRERAEHEVTWLESLATSDVPATVVWGVCDTVSPPRVAMHVWERFLRAKPASNELWLVPDANHYLQHDRPGPFADAVLQSLSRTGPRAPGPVGEGPGAPVRVDHSSPGLPPATDTFAL